MKRRIYRTRSKYGNRKTEIDGIIFDSIKESRRYLELKLLVKAKKIEILMVQPEFILQEKFRDNQGKAHREIKFIADFSYLNVKGQQIVEDVKGMRTSEYKIKMKLFLNKYPNIVFFEL